MSTQVQTGSWEEDLPVCKLLVKHVMKSCTAGFVETVLGSPEKAVPDYLKNLQLGEIPPLPGPWPCEVAAIQVKLLESLHACTHRSNVRQIQLLAGHSGRVRI